MDALEGREEASFLEEVPSEVLPLRPLVGRLQLLFRVQLVQQVPAGSLGLVILLFPSVRLFQDLQRPLQLPFELLMMEEPLHSLLQYSLREAKLSQELSFVLFLFLRASLV